MGRVATKTIICLLALLMLSSCAANVERAESMQTRSIAYLKELRQIRNRSFESELLETMHQILKTDVKPLVGLSEQQIRKYLGGVSYECGSHSAGKVAGCVRSYDIVYSFYASCDNCVGGGPELSLSFDRKHICNRAEFLLSE
jgi:hypothetical protein